MSDERDTPSPDDPVYAHLSPKLRAYLGKSGRKLTKVPKPGEDPELDEAVAAFKALDTEKFEEPPPAQDLTIGMGNASAYVAPVSLPDVQLGETAADEGKIELAMKDVPQALPSYSPTRETVETKVVRFAKQAEAKTVGGGTQKLAVFKVPPAAAPVEVPSEHAPRHGDDEHAKPAGRRRPAGAVLGGAVALAAMTIVIRAAINGDAPAAPTVASAQATAVTAVASSAAPTAAAQSAAPLAARAVPSPSTSATAGPSATSGDTVPTPSPRRPSAANRPAPSDDPYDAATPPPPQVTATPSATAVPPSTQPSAQPKAPTPPPATSGRILGGEE